MQIPLKIAFEGGLEPSDALRERIEHEARKLERFSDRITACRVVVIGRSRRHRHGELYQVRIQIILPIGRDIMLDHNPEADHAHEDVYVAIRDAFDAAQRRLQDHERRFEGKVKSHEAAQHGTVAQIFPELDYGFIAASDGREIYFQRNAVVGNDFDQLKIGATVRFKEVEGDQGPQASTVHLVGKPHVVTPP